ncbi:hypothetical protein [Lactobacillus terrae]|uniref:hypothetical protein n=1 Tax=Lactobacillus terrae TaxID=2269374 RepID=UPI000C1B6D12|nr:hypothetical protein [Lactobacillus terrae]
MSEFIVHLSSNKSVTYAPDKVDIRQNDTQDTLKVYCDDDLKLTTSSVVGFFSTKPDKQLIAIDKVDISTFTDVVNGEDKIVGFTYKLPKEIYQASGKATSTFFRIDGTSTSNFTIRISREAGDNGYVESNSYIIELEEILKHARHDHELIEELLKSIDIDAIKEELQEVQDHLAEVVTNTENKIKEIEDLINSNDVIKKSEAESIIKSIVESMDIDTDDHIEDPELLARIKARAGA